MGQLRWIPIEEAVMKPSESDPRMRS